MPAGGVEAVEEFRLAEGASRHLLDVLPDAVVLVDHTGTVQYVNPAAVRLVGGQGPADVVGHSIWIFVHPEDERHAREREALLRKGKKVDFVEHRLIRLDGEAVPIETASVPCSLGDRPGVLITARDLRGRQMMRQALSDSQDLFYKAFRLGPAAASISYFDDGVLIDVNDQYVDLTGYTRDELIGRSTLELDLWPDPEQRDRLKDELRVRGTIRDLELTVRRKDGALRQVISSIQRIEVNGKACVLVISVDVTDRRQAIESERESRALFRRVFQASPTGAAITRLEDGRILEVNDAWCRFTGFERPEAIGKTTVELNIWATPDLRDHLVQEMREREPLQDVEVELRRKSGEMRTVLVSMQQISVQGESCLLSVVNDITDRKRVTEAIRESEERFRMVADSAPVLIWMADAENNGTYFNRAWLEFTGGNLDEERGSGWLDHIHPDDRPRVMADCNAYVRKRAMFAMEFRMRRHDGVYRWMLDQGVPRFNPDGGLLGYIGSCTDITERKFTEQTLREAKEHAEAMAQLKSTFLTNLTHEIRTPLTVILGFTSILRQGVQKEYARFVQLIERSGRRLLLMLDSMLDLAQLEAGTLRVEQRPYNLGDVVVSVMQTLRPLAEDKGLVFEFNAPQDRVYAQMDHAILTRVLNNVLDNALKFTETGRIIVSMEEQQRRVAIRIEDTGIGIDEHFLPQVFEPFSQESTGLERTHQGSGLGLAVSKRLIELMGGEIEVQSRKGKGSIFTIILPSAA